uniref:WW domain-containing protein n=1 Tax=Karlodinium veneficum TaxID=407301 RepID=A7WPX4_KARVE|nr:unknown [Karlodinium veneficum]
MLAPLKRSKAMAIVGHRSALHMALRRTPAAWSRGITGQAGIPVHAGQGLNKPTLRGAYLPEQDVAKPSLYSIGNDWLIYYKKDGRPYYYNMRTGKTQWEHPLTGEVTPPAAPQYEKPPNPKVLAAVRVIGGFITVVSAAGFLGFAPLAGKLFGEGESHRVVQSGRGRA